MAVTAMIGVECIIDKGKVYCQTIIATANPM